MTEEMLFDMPKQAGEITVFELDKLVDGLLKARIEKDNQKLILKDLEANVNDAEMKVMDALETLGKKSYKAEGIGTVTRVDKLSVRVPALPEEKEQFFAWLRSELGEAGYYAYATVNSQSLNKLYNDMMTAYAERGDIFDMPGVDMPTTRTSLQFRRG